MAFSSMGHSRGGRPNMGGGGFRGGAGGGAFRGGSSGFRGTSGGPKIARPVQNIMSSPAAFGAPVAPPVNMNFSPRRHGGGGLVSSLLGSAVSAGVGVASAAIVNKMHENSQIKLAEKQAEQQAARKMLELKGK